jgi:hypothetical protein
MKQERMDGNTEAPLCDAYRQIPLSHLTLDVSEPIVGWTQFFVERGIEVFEDACGRPSVARHVLTRLLDEQCEREARLAEEAAERATRMTASVDASGVPAIEGGSAIESMMAGPGYTSLHDEFGRPKPNFLVEEIEQGSRQQAAEREAVRRRKEKTT